MGFMIGSAPIRRTVNYLKEGRIIFRNTVKVFTVHYNPTERSSKYASEFVFWHFQQIQYKNPEVQCLTLKNLTPTPFIRIFFEDTSDVIIDIFGRKRDEIIEHLENFTAVCQTKEEIEAGKASDLMLNQPSSFGYGCQRHCMCEVFNQVPCPRIVRLPNSWRQKTKNREEFKIPYFYTNRELESE